MMNRLCWTCGVLLQSIILGVLLGLAILAVWLSSGTPGTFRYEWF